MQSHPPQQRDGRVVAWRPLNSLRTHCSWQVGLTAKLPRFYNFKIASRGSIREPPSPITWVYALTSLSGDSTSVINLWNSTSTRADKLQGGKYGTVKNLLDMPVEMRTVVLKAANDMGWAGSPSASKS